MQKKPLSELNIQVPMLLFIRALALIMSFDAVDDAAKAVQDELMALLD